MLIITYATGITLASVPRIVKSLFSFLTQAAKENARPQRMLIVLPASINSICSHPHSLSPIALAMGYERAIVSEMPRTGHAIERSDDLFLLKSIPQP